MNNTQIIIYWFFLYWIKEAISAINYKLWLYWYWRKFKLYDDRLREFFWDTFVHWDRNEWTLFIPKEEYWKLKEQAFLKKLESFRDIYYPLKNIQYYEIDNKILVVFSDNFRHMSTIWTNKKYRGLI